MSDRGAADVAAKLRERHRVKKVEIPIYPEGYDGDEDTEPIGYRELLVCNHDGHSWPCWTEQALRELVGEP